MGLHRKAAASAPHPLPYPRRGGGGSEKAAHRQRTQGLQVTAPASSRRAFLLIQRMKQAASARFTLYRDKLQATRTHAIARLRLRRRFYRQKWSKTKRRVSIQIQILLFKGLGRAQLQSRIILTRGENYIATTASVLVAACWLLPYPRPFCYQTVCLKPAIDLASAGIIGTALALVLSLSIVPAQKAADVFSAAILKLYARDRTMLWVFALLSCAALLSLLLGTGWSFSPKRSLHPRCSIYPAWPLP